MWGIWLEYYIKEQNTVTSCLGTKIPIKLADVVLISNLELGMERGRYTTGLIEKINKRRINVSNDMDEVRSVAVNM